MKSIHTRRDGADEPRLPSLDESPAVCRNQEKEDESHRSLPLGGPVVVAVLLYAGLPAQAQQTTKADRTTPASPAAATEVNGNPGSPSATTTVDGKQLPPPDPAFGGVIRDGALQSKAWWAPRLVPPKQAPNILLIITDDAGFGVPSTFGGVNPDPLNNQVLELYDLSRDFSQSQNIADKYPDKVREMKQMFIEEAKKYQVFPMDASVAARIVAPRPNITAGRSEFVYTVPMVGLPQGESPMLLNSSYTITADIEVPEEGADGMILTSGGRFAGYGFYLLKGKPVFLWNLVDLNRIKWEGPDALPPGRHILEFDFAYDGLGVGTLAFSNLSGLGRSGTGRLKVDGKAVRTIKMEQTLPMILQWDESFDIGSDTLTGVNDADYKPPFPFTGTLNKLTIKVDRPHLTPDDVEKLQAAQRNNKVSE